MSGSILALLAGYNPEREGRKPRNPKSKTRTRAAPKMPKYDPNELKTNPITKKKEVHREIEDREHEWETVKPEDDFGQRPDELSALERHFFRITKNYQENKAEILKPFWAAGETPRETADRFDQRGFSYETVRLYFRVFNRYNPSPIEIDRGEEE